MTAIRFDALGRSCLAAREAAPSALAVAASEFPAANLTRTYCAADSARPRSFNWLSFQKRFPPRLYSWSVGAEGALP